MTACLVAVGNSLKITSDISSICSGYVLQTSAEYTAVNSGLSTAYLTLIGVDSSTILYVYTWGMGAVLSVWAIGYAVSAAIEIVRKI